MDASRHYKALRAQNFSRAAGTYDASGLIQKRIGSDLIKLIPPDLDPGFICDLGCGTGVHTRALAEKFPRAEIRGVDLAEGMIRTAGTGVSEKRIHFLAADMEGDEWRGAHYDLIFSNLAAQWALDPLKLFSNISLSLAQGGTFALSLFLQETYHELREIFLENELPLREPPKLLSGRNVSALLFEAGLKPMFQSEKKETEHRPDLAGILRNIRTTGTASGMSGVLTPGKFREIEASYQKKWGGGEGLPFTWHYGVFLCRKN